MAPYATIHLITHFLINDSTADCVQLTLSQLMWALPFD
jgi:hypothetical protein